MMRAFIIISLGLAAVAAPGAEAPVSVAPWRLELAAAWRALPAPPITPYSGPFGGEARAFIGDVRAYPEVDRVWWDWQRVGGYDPARDPRRINAAFEAAILEDWRRMGYNCAYKGQVWTYRSGRWLKANGMLGAIDQTLWGQNGEPPLDAAGKPGPRQREGCGSFFVRANFDAGVTLLANFVRNYGDADMLRIGDTHITSSWDEVGLRTRFQLDYRPEAVAEYQRFLSEVWFRDVSPAVDSSGDGSTYNGFTGEALADWSAVRPPRLAARFFDAPDPGDEKWTRPGAFKLWLDFHRYFTFEFFRRTSDAATAQSGRRIECYPFPMPFIVWPGINVFLGLSQYWNARLCPILTTSQCWPDAPAMLLPYAQTDRLARRFGNVVMGWSWFWFGDEAGDLYDGPGDVERALARRLGHRIDGSHHWLYSPQYRGRHQAQRLQLAYWHNFLALQYAPFLARSAPPPAQVALLLPDWTGYFYRIWTYPKQDYAYTAQALAEAHLPFEIVSEEELEIEDGALAPYKILYIVGAEWSTPRVRREIRRFVAAGGHVYVSGDSLTLDIPSGERTDFLDALCGVDITHKHKNPFFPSAQTAADEAWAARLLANDSPLKFQSRTVHRETPPLWRAAGGRWERNDEAWNRLDALVAAMPRQGRGGLAQTAIDMRRPPKIRWRGDAGPAGELVTYGEICTGRVSAGRPIAWYEGAVCGVATERTTWVGTRPGMDLHALAPRLSLARSTEPVNPFQPQPDPGDAARRPWVDIVAGAAQRAGVVPFAAVTVKGERAGSIEALPRVDAAGNVLLILVNHGTADVACTVRLDSEHVRRRLPSGAIAWNLLAAESIETSTDGVFPVALAAGRVAVVWVGSRAALEPLRQAQARLAAMDLSVPAYFRDRPALNQPLYDVPAIPAE